LLLSFGILSEFAVSVGKSPPHALPAFSTHNGTDYFTRDQTDVDDSDVNLCLYLQFM